AARPDARHLRRGSRPATSGIAASTWRRPAVGRSLGRRDTARLGRAVAGQPHRPTPLRPAGRPARGHPRRSHHPGARGGHAMTPHCLPLAFLRLEGVGHPWLWAALLAGGAALLIATYRDIFRRSGRRLSWALMLLRGAGLLALVLALAQPTWTRETETV